MIIILIIFCYRKVKSPSRKGRGGVAVVSDFERFVKIKEQRMKELCVGGLWWVLEEKTSVGGK